MKKVIINDGERFGKLIIIKEIEPKLYPNKKDRQFECVCDCGKIYNTTLSILRNNPNVSCGCDRGLRRSKDVIPGTKKNRLTIIKEIEPYYRLDQVNSRLRRILCLCDCGNEFETRLDSFNSGHAKSCGCILTDGNPNAFHKLYKSEHTIWNGLKGRCLNPNNRRYNDYGGRGITVCDRWINSFQNFIDDVGKRPSPKHSLDRINNDGNYDQSNCKWATIREQNTNRRDSVILNKGDRYGQLTVIEEVESKIRHSNYITYDRYVKCICDCGIIKDFRLSNLRSNKSTTCGHHPRPDIRKPKIDAIKKIPKPNHRKIYETYYNVKITKGNHIHHIDHDYKNNNPENLIELNQKQHTWIHKKMNIHAKYYSRENLIIYIKENFPTL